MRLVLIVISFLLGSIGFAAERSEPSDALKAYLATHYSQRDFSLQSPAPLNSIEPNVYLGRARNQFRAGNFVEAIASLDIYLHFADEDAMALLLRGLSKKLADPPDAEGACADLLRVASLGFDVSAIDGIESFCESQLGWLGR